MIDLVNFIPPSCMLVLKGGKTVPPELRAKFIAKTVPRFTTFAVVEDEVTERSGIFEVAKDFEDSLGDQGAIARYKASCILNEEVGTVFSDEVFNGKNGLLWMDTGGKIIDSKLFFTIDPVPTEEILSPFIQLSTDFPQLGEFAISVFNEERGYLGDVVVSGDKLHTTYDEENSPVASTQCQIVHQFVLNDVIDIVKNAMANIKPQLDEIRSGTIKANEERESISLDDFIEWT